MQRNRLLDEIFDTDDTNRPEEVRRSGRSTALALLLIGWCIQNPGMERVIYDHHDSPTANEHLANMISSIVRALGLQFITVSKHQAGIFKLRCDLFRND